MSSTEPSPLEPDEPRPWPRLNSRQGTDYRIFRSRYDSLTNPRTGESMDRVVLEAPDWVNVTALTPEGRVVIVKQFRFGTSKTTIEIPGGMVDPGEDPMDAGKRELLEETGFTSERWSSLGSVAPNPAFLDNRCHHFLAEDAIQVAAPAPDGGEDIVVTTMSPAEIARGIAAGEIDHALVLTAMLRLFDLRIHDRAVQP